MLLFFGPRVASTPDREAPVRSTRPFPETIRDLRRIAGVSERELTRRASRHGFARDNSTLHRICTGESAALPEHMEAIARALQIEPETFAEYRLWKARCDYDPAAVGWDRAIRNLALTERVEGRTDDVPLSAAELARNEDEGSDEAQAGSS